MDQPADQPKRILLIGDYSNMHSQLAQTLRGLGHDVTLMSDGCGFQNTDRDIDLRRLLPGPAGGALLTARMLGPLHKRLRGYDVVALQSPSFVTLRPKRLKMLFDRLRGENGAVILTAAGTDTVYLSEAVNPASPLRYNEWRIGDRPTAYARANVALLDRWSDPGLHKYTDYFYANIDGAVTALYEYDIAVRRVLGNDKVAYIGIPVDTAALSPFEWPEGDQVRFFLGRHSARMLEKGTDLLERAARTVCQRHPGRASLTVVEDRPYAEYIGTMANSHIMLDQVYSYTPATNAMIAMARGLVTVSGAEPEFYDFIGEHANRPIVNAPVDIDLLTDTLDSLVTAGPDTLRQRGLDSRRFVQRHNDAAVVARRFLDFITGL